MLHQKYIRHQSCPKRQSQPLIETLEGRVFLSVTPVATQTHAITAAAAYASAAITRPNAPSNLSATAVSSSSMRITWALNGGNETNVRVYRWNGYSAQLIATLPAGSTTCTDAGLTASTGYYYIVSAVNSAGETWASYWAYGRTMASITRPNAPSNVSATAISSSSMRITWALNGGNETNVRVYRWNGYSAQLIATLPAGSTTCTDAGLTASTGYYYIVSAVNSAGETWASYWAYGRTMASITRPNAPSNVSATAISSSSMRITWALNGGNETNVRVYRWNGYSAQLIATLPAGSTTCTDTGLSASTGYYYIVSAVNSAGETWASSWAYGSTAASLATQANIQMLATIITSEADGCYATEKLAVGSCVINRMKQHGWTNVADVLGASGKQFAHGKSPTTDALNLALGLLNGTTTPFAGITNFYSPRSMPKEGDSTAGYDVAGGLEQVSGLSYRTYRPSWALTMTYVPMAGVREAYFKFFR